MPVFTKAKTSGVATIVVAAVDSTTYEKAHADIVCDGTADDVDINAAYAQLGGSGILHLCSGTFKLANQLSFVSPKGFWFRGSGRSGTTIEWEANPPDANYGLVHVDSGTDTRLSDFTVYGGGGHTIPSGNPLYGVHFALNQTGFVVDRVFAKACTAAGFLSGNSSTEYLGIFRDCLAYEGYSNGYDAGEATGTRFERCVAWYHQTGNGFTAATNSVYEAIDCFADNNGLNGFNSNWGEPNDGQFFSGCYANGNGQHGFSIGSQNARAIGCYARANGQHGFRLGGDQAFLVGCTAENNNGSLGNYAGIAIQGFGASYTAPTGNVVQGCTVRFGANEKYGIAVLVASGVMPASTLIRGISYIGAVPAGGVAFYSDEEGVQSGQPPQVLVPPANPLVSGTVYQNLSGQTIDAAVPITFNPNGTNPATVAVAIGTAAAPATLWTDSEPAAVTPGRVRAIRFRVPPGWYYSLTATLATIGSAAFIGE